MKKILLSLSVLLITSTSASSVFASGVDLILYYGSRYVGMGGNHVALTGDAYTIFYNPAAMTGTPGGALAFNSSNLLYTYGAPIGAADAQRKSELGLAPLFFLGGTYKLGHFSFGLAAYPTALQGGTFKDVNVTTDVTGKKLGNKLVRIEVAPTVAYEFNNYFSVGMSWKPAYNEYQKYNAQYFTSTMGLHSYTKLSGWDWDGFKFGAFLNNWEGFSAGLTYRPENEIELVGHTDIDYSAALGTADASGVPSYQSFKIPAQLQMGVAYQWIPNRFTTALTYEQTYNESIGNDATQVGALPVASTTVPLHFKMGHSIHLGSEYVFTLGYQQKLRTQLGFAYDSTATRHSNPIAALSPAGEYYGGSIGSQYEFGGGSQSVGLALNYGEIESYSTSAEIDPALANGTTGVRSFQGKYTLDIFMATLDYQYKF